MIEHTNTVVLMGADGVVAPLPPRVALKIRVRFERDPGKFEKS